MVGMVIVPMELRTGANLMASQREARKSGEIQVLVHEKLTGRQLDLGPLPVPAHIGRESAGSDQPAESLTPAPRKRAPISWLSCLAALLLIGCMIFLSLPTTSVYTGPERSLGITRAEALNIATAALIQSRGRERANAEWNAAPMDQDRYEILCPYLAFAPEKLEDYMPEGYAIVFPNDLKTLSKLRLVYGQQIGY